MAAFGTEAREGNTAMPDAVTCLKSLFHDENASGPVRAAHFVYGEIEPNEGGDVRVFRQQIQQDVVTLGRLLLRNG